MQNISIGRYEEDPQAQGVIKPADGRWQLVIDKEGYPHLYVQTSVEDDEGTVRKGMLCFDDMLPDGMTIREIMDGGAWVKPTPEEAKAAEEEYVRSREKNPIPCPR